MSEEKITNIEEESEEKTIKTEEDSKVIKPKKNYKIKNNLFQSINLIKYGFLGKRQSMEIEDLTPQINNLIEKGLLSLRNL